MSFICTLLTCILYFFINRLGKNKYVMLEMLDATIDQAIARFYPNEKGAGDVELTRQVVFQICQGLDHIHKNGIAHGDLNPDVINYFHSC